MRAWWTMIAGLLLSAAAQAADEVKLVSPGEGARAVLRYQVSPGPVSVPSSTQMAMTATMMGQTIPSKVPRITALLSGTVSAEPRGFQLAVAWKDVKVESGATGVGGMMADALKKGLEGAQATFVVTPRGEVVEARSARVGGGDAEEGFDLSRWLIPFPEEPVGVGARWTVEGVETASNGLSVTSRQAVTLVARNGSTVQLVVEVENQGTPGTFNKDGMQAKVNKLHTTGAATLELRLDQPLPTSGSSAITNLLDLDVSGLTTSTSTQIDTRIGVAAR